MWTSIAVLRLSILFGILCESNIISIYGYGLITDPFMWTFIAVVGYINAKVHFQNSMFTYTFIWICHIFLYVDLYCSFLVLCNGRTISIYVCGLVTLSHIHYVDLHCSFGLYPCTYTFIWTFVAVFEVYLWNLLSMCIWTMDISIFIIRT